MKQAKPAPRDIFQTHRAGPGKDIKHNAAFDQLAAAPFSMHQHVIQSLSHTVGRGPGPSSGRRDQRAAAPGARDNAHLSMPRQRWRRTGGRRQLLAQHARRDFLDAAALKGAKLERAVCDADQAGDGQA